MDTNNPTNQPKEQQTSTPIKTQSSAPTSNNQNKIDTDSIVNFIQEILKETLNNFGDTKKAVPLIISGLVPVGIMLIGTLLAIPTIGLSLLVAIVLSVLWSIPMLNISLKVSQNQTVTMNDVTSTFSKIIPTIIQSIKIIIESIVKLFKPPFILPGIKHAIGSSLFLYENLATNKPMKDAAQTSRTITTGYILNIFVLQILLAVASSLISSITLGLGSIFTAPFTTLAIANTYKKLKK